MRKTYGAETHDSSRIRPHQPEMVVSTSLFFKVLRDTTYLA